LERQVLHDSNKKEFYSIESTQTGWILAQWHGEINEERVKQGGLKSLEVIQATGCPYLINDNRDLKGSWLEANDWIEQELMPKLFKAGLRYVAHIYSPEFITRFSAVDLESRLQSIDFRLFSELSLAEDWIRSVM